MNFIKEVNVGFLSLSIKLIQNNSIARTEVVGKEEGGWDEVLLRIVPYS